MEAMNKTPQGGSAAAGTPDGAADRAYGAPPRLPAEARDRLYAACARGITEAGAARESLFLARLALLLFEQVGDEARCAQALDDALRDLPVPSLSAEPAAVG